MRVGAAETERAAVVAPVRRTLYTILIVAGAASMPAIGEYGPLPTTALLDAWMILFMFAALIRGPIRTMGIIFALACYLLFLRVFPALWNNSPVEDFLQAYRWVLYLIAFAFAVGRQWVPVEPLVKVMWALLGMALTKAALTFALMGPGNRPGLLLENNFEMALFAGLIAVLYTHLNKSRLWAIGALGVLTFLSGSRSGAVAFLVLAVFALSQQRSRDMFVRHLAVFALPLLVSIPVAIFGARAATSTNIDRLNFLDVFLNDTRPWGAATWLFGTTPITPLSNTACERLAYYERLFSSTGDGSCYSVILHAFVLRIVYDAGIVGLIIAFATTWYLMRKGGVRVPLALCLLGIAVTNSLSVSGLNNPYVALPILLAITTAASPPPVNPAPLRIPRGYRRSMSGARK